VSTKNLIPLLQNRDYSSCVLPSCALIERAAERKHRHIVEVGLSLLAHVSMTLKFRDDYPKYYTS
jgi:hypothetical protein